MATRSLLSIIFASAGAIFFVLALHAWTGSSDRSPSVAIEEVSHQVQMDIDLATLFEHEVSVGNDYDLRSYDMISLMLVDANYDCSSCISDYNSYVSVLGSTTAWGAVSVGHAAIIVERSHRTAVHFAKVNRLNSPVFRISGVEERVGAGLMESNCLVVLVDPKKDLVFFAFDVGRMGGSLAPEMAQRAAQVALLNVGG